MTISVQKGALYQKWQREAEHFAQVVDRQGTPLDPGIFDAVVSLNALDAYLPSQPASSH